MVDQQADPAMAASPEPQMQAPEAPEMQAALDETQPAGEHSGNTENTGAGAAAAVIGLQKIQKLKVRVQAMLGTAQLTISELANLERGDVINLETKIGDSISILANGDEIARADIIVTQDDPPRFALTLTEVVQADNAAK